jgi:hypothetical protein
MAQEPRYLPFTVKGLRVDESIFTQGFVEYCNIDKCGGGCCHSGVYADKAEYERILTHKDAIAAVMDDTQVKDPAAWFDEVWINDTDFPSGKAVGTNVQDRDGGISGYKEGCVFLDKRNFCSIQVAAVEAGLHRWSWKPDYCILFPVTVVEGVITYDDSHSEDLHYCGPNGRTNYVHSVFEAMTDELKYFLGESEYLKLYQYFIDNRDRFETERKKQALVEITIKK